jgi:hypothetical protein
MHSEYIEAKTFLDVMSYIFSLIDMCNDKNVHYYDQSLIVMEPVATTDDPMDAEDKSSMLSPDFFHKSKVSRLIVIERPNESVQIYCRWPSSEIPLLLSDNICPISIRRNKSSQQEQATSIVHTTVLQLFQE